MSGTNYIENALLDHLVGNATYTGGVLHCALATAVASGGGESGSFTEVSNSGTAYARQQVPASSFASASSGSVTTSANIQFPVATAGYGTVTHLVLTDSATYGGGNVILIQALTAPKTVDTDDQFVVNSGNLTISLD